MMGCSGLAWAVLVCCLVLILTCCSAVAVFSAVSGLELSMEKEHHKCKDPIIALLLILYFLGLDLSL